MRVAVGTKTFLIKPTKSADLPFAEHTDDGDYVVDLPEGAHVIGMAFIEPFLTVQYYLTAWRKT